ncbi:Di-copper centre-containing protein, partial [Stipitochalara longipes BDJ]
CESLKPRPEWRTLTLSERDNYISAVQCLATKPSRLNSSDTLYDDFTRVHILLDKSYHLDTSFLAWHRYFLHVYETTLQEICGFKGSMPYWNWSLDTQNLTMAPVFDPQYGFGGNGNPNANALGKGNCVTDGGVSGITFKYFDSEVVPHCLFRTFDHSNQRLSGEKYSDSAIGKILKKPDIISFMMALNSAHASVHMGLGGDMEGFSAPNDPIFFLHHAQVDRLWWLWQKNHMYINRSTGFVLNKSLAMSGFVKDIEVSEALDTNNYPFCYQY